MDLSTTYLGMKLPHPMVAGASPLSDEIDSVRAPRRRRIGGHRSALAV